jgi:peptidoglycan biosynthesis protein MviN/MurJ (putative lipid II flippase)
MKALLLANNLRSRFFGLFLISFLLIISTSFSNETISISVEPTSTSKYFGQSVDTINNNIIVLAGSLKIKDPTLVQKILLPTDMTLLNFMKLFAICSFSLFAVILLQKIDIKENFNQDAMILFKILAWGIIFYVAIDLLRTIFYSKQEVEKLTNKQFTLPSDTPILFNILILYCSGICFKLTKVYQKAITLQQEQDLTI